MPKFRWSFIWSLRGDLGKSEPGNIEEEIVSESESECDLTEQEVEEELEIEHEFILCMSICINWYSSTLC